ncbi:hypothetical protein BpHYR1_038556 [Brachionus plicatilis]|uniref:Uncharacterized protein n=1 Tax=Brachionus plicatilis TaxID=10195 RepID=A0A3M7R2Q3_BRAPC|nr:hypothetical protein BpHYR1_038556 [Brachionus plicatilis]
MTFVKLIANLDIQQKIARLLKERVSERLFLVRNQRRIQRGAVGCSNAPIQKLKVAESPIIKNRTLFFRE